jgi:predicted phage-related endonuclease
MGRIWHNIEQRSPEWYLARIGKVTSSNMKRIMAQGAGAETYRAEILSQIKLLKAVHSGHCTYEEAFDQFDVSTRAMRVGSEFEKLAVSEFATRTGNEVRPVGFVEFDNIPIGASTDGLVGDDYIVEVKVPNSAKHEWTIQNKRMPPEHIVQVQSELWVSGKAGCWFLSFDYRLPAGEDLFAIIVPRDEEKIQQIAEVAIPFAKSIPMKPFDFDPLSLASRVYNCDDLEGAEIYDG